MTRLHVPVTGDDIDPEQVVTVGDLELYPAGLSLRLGGHKTSLPLREFEVLLVLARNAGKVVPVRTLLDHAWGLGYVDNTGTLKVHVNRLRKRIKNALGVDYIRTVRGIGYSLDPELASQGRR
jgi:DNA-binding response OmpR family regulator